MGSAFMVEISNPYNLTEKEYAEWVQEIEDYLKMRKGQRTEAVFVCKSEDIIEMKWGTDEA